MRDIDFKTLRLLVAVCEHGNMARAADQALIETSAISKRIAQLESDLGTTLLVRSRRGVQPTPAGAALLEHARNILFTAERMAIDVASYGAGTVGHVRVVASASAIAESLLEDVSSFMREPAQRAIKVDVDERPSNELVRQLREKSASIGVCWDDADLAGLEHRPYRADELAIAVQPRHPLAKRTSVRFEETLAYEQVGFPPSTAVHAMLNRAAMKVGRAIRYRAIVSNFDAALRVVSADLGISVVPLQIGLASATHHDVKLVPLTDAWAKRRFVVAYPSFAALQPPAQRLVDHLVAKAAEAGPPASSPRRRRPRQGVGRGRGPDSVPNGTINR